MPLLDAITFTTPAALAALALLPVIWWLLRYTPPKPRSIRFPPLRLLLDLVSRQDQPDRTPWWLLLLRLAIAALLIVAVAHPLYSPGRQAPSGGGALLLIVDDSWAAARDWELRKSLIAETMAAAERGERPVALATTSPHLRPEDLSPVAATTARERAAALEPRALDPDRASLLGELQSAFGSADTLDVIWLSDGLDHGSSQAFAEGLAKLAQGHANVQAIVPDASSLPAALSPPIIEGGKIKIKALRPRLATSGDIVIDALAANGRSLADGRASFAAGAGKAEAVLDLPVELRNEAQSVAIKDERTAASVYLLDDRWRRKTVGLIAGSSLELAQPLLSPLYYVSRALEPYAELSEPVEDRDLAERLAGGLSMLVLADVGVLPGERHNLIEKWVNGGGLLLRFAGPRLAGGQDDLVPVVLREGDRSLGSALSWEEPQPLQPFPDQGPFAGLNLDPDVRISRQVLAEPDADLGAKVWASLADGTPLVTAKRQGNGLIVLVHVTANADWSNLPLSGLFVDMLRRIVDLAPGAGAGTAPATANSPDTAAAYLPYRALDGFGDLADPPADSSPVAAAAIDRTVPSPDHPAGLYRRGSATRAINLVHEGEALTAISGLPGSIAVRGLVPVPVIELAHWLFGTAFLLFLLDCAAALFVSGRWRSWATGAAATIIALSLVAAPDSSRAQTAAEDPATAFALANTLSTRLAYVTTGDQEVDDISLAGLHGLGNVLLQRTSVEPGEPVAIDIEKDEVVFFPLLYWPVIANAPLPSPAALEKIDKFMKNGGTILFDTRDQGSNFGTTTGAISPEVESLRRMLAKLDIPALEPVPPDHVLTKAFYLLQNFPGRYDLGELWVEKSEIDPGGERNADGVSSIMIGANDYAAAWATDPDGRPLYATVPGGERQRELAYRAGINIVMYALTGNYKADQVHVPALLERLGQ